MPPDFDPHIDPFLEMMAAERGAAMNTLEAYRRDLLEIAGAIAPTPLANAENSELSRAIQGQAERNLSARTQARRLWFSPHQKHRDCKHIRVRRGGP